MDTEAKPQTGHFGRLNALVEGGWLAVLTAAELAMWVAYEKYAGPDGMAFPDSATLARLIGHASKSHVGAIRQALASHGLLRVLEAGGGRGCKWKVQMIAPGMAPSASRPERGVASADEKVPGLVQGKVPDYGTLFEQKGSRSGEIKVPDPAQKGSRSGEHNKDEQPIEQPIEQPNGSADVPRGRQGGQSRGARANRPRKQVTEPALSPAQRVAWDAFREWWTFEAVPGYGGVPYEWAGSRDGKALKLILSCRYVGWDLGRAKLLARVFLEDRDQYLSNRGKTLYDLAERLNRFAPLAAAAEKRREECGTNGHTASRDDYAIPSR